MRVRFMRKARIAPGKRDAAIEFAAMMSDHFGDRFDSATSWGLEVGGDVGTIHWFADHASMGALESVIERSSADAETNKLLNEAADLFIPGSVHDKIIAMM